LCIPAAGLISAVFQNTAAETSIARMKSLSVFYDKTLSAQGYSMVWAKHCDVREDKAELGEKSFDSY